MTRICDELEELEDLNYEQKPFVSYEILKDFLNREKIQGIISGLVEQQKLPVYQQQEVVTAIHRHGIRLFATLLTISRPELIVTFIEYDHFLDGQLDSRLPLSKLSLSPILEDGTLCSRFDKHQWKFLPPLLRADQSHRELAEKTTLPFKRPKSLGEGGFGEVHEMTLPAACQDLFPQKEGEVWNGPVSIP